MQDSHRGVGLQAQLVCTDTKHILNGGLNFRLLSAGELSVYTIEAWSRIMVVFKSLSLACQNTLKSAASDGVNIWLWLKCAVEEPVTSEGSAWLLIHIKWYPEYCTRKYLHCPRALLWLIINAFYSFTVLISMRPSWVLRPRLWNIIILAGNHYIVQV